MASSLPPSFNSFPLKPSPTTKPQSTNFRPHFAVSLLQLSKARNELSQIHALLIKAKISNAFVYNSMIKSYSRCGDHHTAFLIFAQMLFDVAVIPDNFTYTFVCNACSKGLLIFEARQVHARMVKGPFRLTTPCWNALVDCYVKIGTEMWRVRKIFDEMNNKDVVTWNCLLDGYVKVGDLENAQRLFDGMLKRDVISWTILLVGYANAGSLEEAFRLFNRMPEKKMISWTVMIGGYVKSGQYNEALVLFEEMQTAGVTIDKITLTLLLTACAGLGALDQGRWIHSYIQRHNTDVDAELSTALIDMYGKCGRVDLAYKVFREFLIEKTFLWNAMLGGFAAHSCGVEALQLFSEMLRRRVKPNEITFINLLSACSHSGLIDDGLEIFYSMSRDHKIVQSLEHYGCVVDLLSRRGFLDEAFKVVETMPLRADGNVLRSLLSACKVYGNIELGEIVGKMLMEIEPLDDGNYVLVSNIYADKNRWEDAARLRRAMKEGGVKKTPGCSCIELDGVVHTFISGDKAHPESEEIYLLLNNLVKQLTNDDYSLEGIITRC